MKPVVILVFLALAIPASARPHPLRWARSHKLQIAADALLIGASALDVASTRSAIGNGPYEANPLYGRRPSLARLVTIKAAFDLPVVLGSHYLDRRTSGDSRWRRAEVLLPALAVAIPQFWAAHHNWTLPKTH